MDGQPLAFETDGLPNAALREILPFPGCASGALHWEPGNAAFRCGAFGSKSNAPPEPFASSGGVDG
jgi:hypothetical protein